MNKVYAGGGTREQQQTPAHFPVSQKKENFWTSQGALSLYGMIITVLIAPLVLWWIRGRGKRG